MLVIKRKIGEAIIINGGIRLKVYKITGNTIHLAIDAPKDVRIEREEIAGKAEKEVAE